MATNGHLLTHIPQPIHNNSEIKQIFDVGPTSIHNFPVLLTGHIFAHSYLHFLGLHLSGLMIAILNLSVSISILLNIYECFNLVNYNTIYFNLSEINLYD